MIHPTRRTFCLTAAASLITQKTRAQTRSETHPDVAAIDHDRILAAAADAVKSPITPITTIPAPRTPGTPQDFYSEPEDFFPDPTDATAPWLERLGQTNPEVFTTHRGAVYQLGVTIASLTAAFAITSEAPFAARAADHLRAWFIAPGTRMNPSLQFAQRIPNTKISRPEGIIESLPLAEVARSLRFLESSTALTPDELATIRKWFADYATWLNDSRTAGLARDRKDHHASSWLFQAAAYADANALGKTSDDASLSLLRHRFKTATLRAQMNGSGIFPREVSTPTPFRNSLLNLDLLTLACKLLTTRFDNPWEYELQDGPGLRAAIAYHFPFIRTPATWPYPADIAHFKELPARRICLLLAGRAYTQPAYVDLWKTLSPLPQTAALELLRTFPITQPLLWFTRPKPLRA